MCQPVLVLPHSTQQLLHLPYHLNDENCATSRTLNRTLWTGKLNVAHKLSVVATEGVVKIKRVGH